MPPLLKWIDGRALVGAYFIEKIDFWMWNYLDVLQDISIRFNWCTQKLTIRSVRCAYIATANRKFRLNAVSSHKFQIIFFFPPKWNLPNDQYIAFVSNYFKKFTIIDLWIGETTIQTCIQFHILLIWRYQANCDKKTHKSWWKLLRILQSAA